MRNRFPLPFPLLPFPVPCSPFPVPGFLNGHPLPDAPARSRTGARLPRSVVRILRHHRDPRHHAGPGARGNQVLAVWIDRRGDYRRLAAGAGDDLQVGGGGDQSRRRQVGDRRRQQAGRSRGALPRARPVRRNIGRTLHRCRRCRHQSRRHGVHQARDRPCRRPAGAVGRSVPGDGLWRVRRHQGRGAGAVGERPAQREDRRGPGVRERRHPPVPPPPRRRRETGRHRHRPREGQAGGPGDRRPGGGTRTRSTTSRPTSTRPARSARPSTTTPSRGSRSRSSRAPPTTSSPRTATAIGSRSCVFCMRPTT